MEAARDLQRYLSGLHRDRDRVERKKAIMRYVSQLSKDLPDLANKGKSAEIEKKLVHLIETKYASTIANGENIESESENGNGKKKGKEEEEEGEGEE
jgi:DNA topoisomerase VI subunit B